MAHWIVGDHSGERSAFHRSTTRCAASWAARLASWAASSAARFSMSSATLGPRLRSGCSGIVAHPTGSPAPHRDQLCGWHLELVGRLLDRRALVAHLDTADPLRLRGHAIDIPRQQRRWLRRRRAFRRQYRSCVRNVPPIRRCGLYAPQGERGGTPSRPEVPWAFGRGPNLRERGNPIGTAGLGSKGWGGSLTNEQARAGHLGLLDGYIAFGLSKWESYL
jgi:hypothetical protein